VKVGDLVKITVVGEYNMDDPLISEGDKAIVLKVYEGDSGWVEGEILYKIAMIKDGHIIEHLLGTEIKKFE
jgi:hypothetical protein